MQYLILRIIKNRDMTEILQFSDKGFPDGPGGHDVISTHIVKEYICEV